MKRPLALAALLSTTAVLAQTPPETIALPGGYQPEGIVAGDGGELYVGSLADGAIYRADAATGEGDVLVAGEEGRVTVGLAYDPRTGYLYAAGGATGLAHVFDTASGTLEQSYTLTPEGTFVNDAVVSGDSVYFTDSNREVLYRLELGEGGALPGGDGAVTEIALSGDFSAEPDAFNANGVEAAEDGTLIVVKSVTGELFRVDPESGESTLIDLGSESVTNGDGILLDGDTLYVVQNRDNRVAVVDLAEDLASGTVSGALTHPEFDVPTTVTSSDGALYAVNARFGTEPTPDTEYAIVRVTP
jgi:sugar lactone lactonase YvrE